MQGGKQALVAKKYWECFRLQCCLPTFGITADLIPSFATSASLVSRDLTGRRPPPRSICSEQGSKSQGVEQLCECASV